ncbi:MAG: MarR family transcriptional regulator [Eubacterium sp.]|nr:MarR family transcriptional regulator [Eubacterium sp.]
MEKSFHYLSMVNHMKIQKKLLDRVKSEGLTSGQPKVLDYLKDHDGASQKEIAAGCHIEAGSLTSVLNRMEEQGLICRRTLNGNRRTFHIFLTEKGRAKEAAVARAFEAIEAQAFSGIDAAEQEKFMAVLLKICDNLKGEAVHG